MDNSLSEAMNSLAEAMKNLSETIESMNLPDFTIQENLAAECILNKSCDN